MQKAKRILAIERIIAGENIASQEMLLRKLKGRGIICTQATLSRNLKQLGVSRIPDGKGGYRYALTGKADIAKDARIKFNIIPVIREIVEAKGLMVIRTIPGNANATAYFIDNAGRYEIAGTIAGDDTILVIPRDGVSLNQIHSCLEVIMPGLHRQVERKGVQMAKRKRISEKRNFK